MERDEHCTCERGADLVLGGRRPKDIPPLPACGEQGWGEGRSRGLGGGWRGCRFLEKGTFLRTRFCMLRPPPHLGLSPNSWGRGNALWKLRMRARTRANSEQTTTGCSSANEVEKTSPLSPLAGSRAGVRGGRELSKVECRDVVLRNRAAFADGLLRAATTPSPGPRPPILGGEGTRFGSSKCKRERGLIQSKRLPYGLQL